MILKKNAEAGIKQFNLVSNFTKLYYQICDYRNEKNCYTVYTNKKGCKGIHFKQVVKNFELMNYMRDNKTVYFNNLYHIFSN